MHSTSRTAENFSESGLVSNTGQESSKWGRYIVKELLDNSLEAGEDPTITVRIETHEGGTVRSIHVSDNGPGLPESDLDRVFKYVDSFGGTKRHYCLPTRGNQGNALMTALGIQYLCDRALSVQTRGREFRITADPDTFVDGVVIGIDEVGETDITGFGLTVVFGDKGPEHCDLGRIKRTVATFATLNPQSTIRFICDGDTTTYERDSDHTVETISLAERNTTGKASWFTYDGFKNRVEADVQVDPELALKDFVREFCKLSSKHQEVLDDIPEEIASGTIRDLYDEDDHMRSAIVRDLFDAMCRETSAFSPSGLDRSLGSIGKDLKRRVVEQYGNQTLANQLRENGGEEDEDLALEDLAVYKSGGDVVSLPEKTVPFHFEIAAIPTEAWKKNRGRCNFTFGINQSITYSEPGIGTYYHRFSVKHHRADSSSSYSRISTAFEKFGTKPPLSAISPAPISTSKTRGSRTSTSRHSEK